MYGAMYLDATNFQIDSEENSVLNIHNMAQIKLNTADLRPTVTKYTGEI